MTIILAILAIIAIIILAELFCAPWGWQDSRGFHYGKPPEDDE